MSSFENLNDVPLTVDRVVNRRVKYVVQFGSQFYPATSIEHICEIFDEVGIHPECALNWCLHRHIKQKSRLANQIFQNYSGLKLHKIN